LLLSSLHSRLLHSFPTRRSSDLDDPPVHLAGLRLGARVAPRPGPHPLCRVRPSLERKRQPAPPRLLLQGALPGGGARLLQAERGDRKSTRLNSSHVSISYAVFCL